ncbi:MAG TPA: glyoxalase [Candidatus Moranbacteria bacterium]|nr:glyoxalase [Candidatus Moranbacteria bacterium]
MNPVVHFEMPYEDKNRMAGFYAKAFGWKAEMMGEEFGNYVLVTTSETDQSGMPKKIGMINGGFYKKPEDKMGQSPSVVIGIDDTEEAMEKIKAAGGKILGEPMDIPGYGLYISFLDTEGNRVGAMQPYQKM